MISDGSAWDGDTSETTLQVDYDGSTFSMLVDESSVGTSSESYPFPGNSNKDDVVTRLINNATSETLQVKELWIGQSI